MMAFVAAAAAVVVVVVCVSIFAETYVNDSVRVTNSPDVCREVVRVDTHKLTAGIEFNRTAHISSNRIKMMKDKLPQQ